MADLQTNLGVLAMRKVDNLLQRTHVAIIPNAGIFGRDAAFWGDGVYLSKDKRSATGSKASQMLFVPGSAVAILCGVPTCLKLDGRRDGVTEEILLAHGRYDDAVA